MFHRQEEFLPQIITLKAQIQFHLILAVREPLEMLSSAYMQQVKREGFFGSIEDYGPRENHIRRAADTIAFCKQNEIKISTVNYSALGRKVSERIFELIDSRFAQDGDIDLDLSKTVNRSLTYSELRFLLAVNRICGRSAGKLISDNLVEKLPEISSESVPVAFPTYLKMRERLRGSVDFVNEALEPEEQLQFDFVSSAPTKSQIEFSEAQLEVILNALSSRLMTEGFQFNAEN